MKSGAYQGLRGPCTLEGLIDFFCTARMQEGLQKRRNLKLFHTFNHR